MKIYLVSKRKLGVVFLLCSFIMLGAGTYCWASDKPVIKFRIGEAQYTVDNITKPMDASPFIENDRTYLPVYYVGEALGLGTTWSPEKNQVTVFKKKSAKINGVDSEVQDQLIFTIGSKKLIYIFHQYNLINGWKLNQYESEMDVTPVIRDSRTYLPAGHVVQFFDYSAFWKDAEQTVTLNPIGYGKGGM